MSGNTVAVHAVSDGRLGYLNVDEHSDDDPPSVARQCVSLGQSTILFTAIPEMPKN